MAGSDDKSPTTASNTSSASDGKVTKAVQRGKGKGKALNALAAASGRDPTAIVAAAEASAKKSAAEEEARKVSEKEAFYARLRAEREKEVTPAQVYNSLSAEEQYRFECFRRSGFPAKHVEKFVAKIFVEEAQRRYLVRRGAVIGLGGRLTGDSTGGVLDLNSEAAAAKVKDVSSSDGESSSSHKRHSKYRKKRTKQSLLNEESKRRRGAMDQPLPYFDGTRSVVGRGFDGGSRGTGSGSNSTQQQIPPLENLVAPDAASEIVAVVSTLAKCYGQRLVAAARRIADAEEEATKLESGDEVTSATSLLSNAIKPLQPHHFLDAHRHRTNAGLDPGFWMADRTWGSKTTERTKGGGVAAAAALGTVDRTRINYLAALAAQDAYDEDVKKKENNGGLQRENNGDGNEGDQKEATSNKMDVT